MMNDCMCVKCVNENVLLTGKVALSLLNVTHNSVQPVSCWQTKKSPNEYSIASVSLCPEAVEQTVSFHTMIVIYRVSVWVLNAHFITNEK